MTSDGYLAVYVDESTPLPMFAHPDDPHLVILAHPGESRILKQIGYSCASAALGGRLVAVANVFCLVCGQQFEIRRLTAGLGAFGCLGCLAIVAGATVAGGGVGLLMNHWNGFIAGWVISAMLLTAALSGVESAVVRFVLRRHADRAARVATPETCPACGNGECSQPGSLREDALPCRACGQRAVRFRAVAKS